MPAITNITLADGQATPVVHTFEPVKTGADVAHYEDKSSPQYIGFWKLIMQLKRPSGPSNRANRNLEAIIRIETPVLETLGTADSGFAPVPTVSFRPQVEIRFTLPERCTYQQRKDLRTMVANLMGQLPAADLVENLRVPY